MRICIVGGGGGASNAANVIRSLDRQAHIGIFTNKGEIYVDRRTGNRKP